MHKEAALATHPCAWRGLRIFELHMRRVGNVLYLLHGRTVMTGTYVQVTAGT